MRTFATKRSLIAIAVLISAAVAGASVYVYRLDRPLDSGTGPDSLRLLPPDAKAIAYIDVAALRNLPGSPLSSILDSKNAQLHETDHEYNDFVRDTGFDYRRDLDHVAIAFWPEFNLDKATTPKLGAGRMFVIADGRFDVEKIKAYALRAGKTVNKGSREIYLVPGTPGAAFAFLSPGRIALVSGGEVDLNTLADPAGREPDPEIAASISRVGGAPLFAVGDSSNLPESFYGTLRNSPQLEQMARGVQSLAFAAEPDGSDVDVVLDSQCDSTKTAAQIATLLEFSRAGVSMFLSNSGRPGQINSKQAAFLQGLLSQVKVDQEDRWVRLTLALTPEMLGRAASLPSAPTPTTPRQ